MIEHVKFKEPSWRGGRREECDARNSKNPRTSWDGAAPGMVSQIALTSAVGPPISVVPVSMAAKASLPVPIFTDCPPTETAGGKSQDVSITATKE